MRHLATALRRAVLPVVRRLAPPPLTCAHGNNRPAIEPLEGRKYVDSLLVNVFQTLAPGLSTSITPAFTTTADNVDTSYAANPVTGDSTPFRVTFSGDLTVDTAGTYLFRLPQAEGAILTIDGQSVILQPSLPGDDNLTGDVTFGDYQTLMSNYGMTSGATWAQGDFNGDGAVNMSDYQTLMGNWGNTVSARVIDDTNTAGFNLSAGRHTFQLSYYQFNNSGNPLAQLQWKGPGASDFSTIDAAHFAKLPAVTGVTARRNFLTGGVDLAWTPAPQSTKTLVQRSTDGGQTWQTLATVPNPAGGGGGGTSGNGSAAQYTDNAPVPTGAGDPQYRLTPEDGPDANAGQAPDGSDGTGTPSAPTSVDDSFYYRESFEQGDQLPLDDGTPNGIPNAAKDEHGGWAGQIKADQYNPASDTPDMFDGQPHDVPNPNNARANHFLEAAGGATLTLHGLPAHSGVVVALRLLPVGPNYFDTTPFWGASLDTVQSTVTAHAGSQSPTDTEIDPGGGPGAPGTVMIPDDTYVPPAQSEVGDNICMPYLPTADYGVTYTFADNATSDLTFNLKALGIPDGQDLVIDNAVVTLLPPPTVSVHGSGAAAERDAADPNYAQGSGAAKFTFTRDEYGLDQPLDVKVSVAGTAATGVNYNWEGDVNPSSGTIHFNANQSTVTAIVHAFDDQTPGWTKDVKVNVLDDNKHYLVDDTARSADISIADSDLGIQLGDGTDNQILQGSADGTKNQTDLTLNAPADGPTGATVTLSVSEPSDLVRVFDADGNLVLGGAAGMSHTWTIGQPSFSVPTSFKVGVVGGSVNVGDIQFHVADSDVNAQSDVPNPCTSNEGESKATTAVRLEITSMFDPDGNAAGDWTDKTENWLVGQMSDLYAALQGPADLTKNATFSWSVGGNVLREYVVNGTSATTIPLTDDDGGRTVNGVPLLPHTGKKLQEVKFFWVATSAGNSENQSVSVTVSGIPGGDLTVQTKFSVSEPTVTGTPTAIGPVTIGSPNSNGIPQLLNSTGSGTVAFRWGVSVQAPLWSSDGTVTGINRWGFAQLIDTQDTAANGAASYHQEGNGQWLLDGGLQGQNAFPWPGSNIVDEATQQSVGIVGSANYLSAGPNKYDFVDTPGDNLSDPHTVYSVGSNGSQSVVFDREKLDNSFKTYVMFLPSGLDSQWVPVQVATWSWIGDAQLIPNSGGLWGLTSKTDPNVSSGPAPAVSEPTWGAASRDHWTN